METDKGVAPAPPPTPRVDRRATAATRVAAVTSFASFFRAVHRPLLVTAMWAGATKPEAEDAVSKALTEMLPSWIEIVSAPGSDPFAYARKAVLHNVIKEKVHGLDRTRQRLAERRADTAQSGVDPNLSAWEDKQWVRRMLQSLPDGQRDVMALVVDGFKPIEIAARLGRTPQAIRRSLCDARERLKAVLQSDAHDEQPPRSTRPAGKEAR